MKRTFLLILVLAAALSRVNAQRRTHAPPHAHRHARTARAAKFPTHYGTASFYANKFEGRRTANGEIFRQQKLSAASNLIPMNSWVRITNMRNKRKIILRINDRMHPRNPRLIDLSRSAAARLKYTGRGIVRVKVEVFGKRLPRGYAGD